jgi:hypothetical protein
MTAESFRKFRDEREKREAERKMIAEVVADIIARH